MNVLTFLAVFPLIATIIVQLLKKSIKIFVKPRLGDLGVTVFLLIVSIALALAGKIWFTLPFSLQTSVVAIFTSAIAIYQVLYKAIILKAIRGKLDENDR